MDFFKRKYFFNFFYKLEKINLSFGLLTKKIVFWLRMLSLNIVKKKLY